MYCIAGVCFLYLYLIGPWTIPPPPLKNRLNSAEQITCIWVTTYQPNLHTKCKDLGWCLFSTALQNWSLDHAYRPPPQKKIYIYIFLYIIITKHCLADYVGYQPNLHTKYIDFGCVCFLSKALQKYQILLIKCVLLCT